MLILALDTTTAAGSCALLRDGRVLGERAGDPQRAQAIRLPRDLASLLEHLGVALHAIDAFAVGVGPGSFTGLRVGIATMQGLALATDRPLVGVSALDALARSAAAGGGGVQSRTAAWVDAWRGDVYAALYENGLALAPPVVAHPAVLLRELAELPPVFTGDGALAHRSAIRAALGSDARFTHPVAPLLAAAMGALADEAIRAGLRPPPHAIRPLYVRRSDAELARDATGDGPEGGPSPW